jgi:hypothetical protein
MNENKPTGMLAHALAIAKKHNWRVFPCSPKDKSPSIPKSEGGNGFKDATLEPDVITEMWSKRPKAMIGVATGAASGFFAVDLDRKEGKGDGVATWEVWERDHGAAATRQHVTPSTGRHLLFRYIPGIGCIPLGKLGEGVEIKGDGGYIAAPPSVMDNGGRYTVSEGPQEIADAPEWLLDKLRAHYTRHSSTSESPGKGTSPLEIEAALFAIPCKDLDYHAWVYVGSALYKEYGAKGKPLFLKWSATDEARYDPAKCARKWDEQITKFTKHTIGTLFYYADEADEGWRERFATRMLPASRYFGEAPVAPPSMLIKGLLPETGVAPIVGQSGAGKTFLAVQMGVCFIRDTKQDFYIDRYRIKRKGGVLYLALEGQGMFSWRLLAAFEDVLNKQLSFGDQHRLPFAWNTYSPNLFANDVDKLIRLVEREATKQRKDFGVDLVSLFIDTLGLAALFENEDRSAQITKVYEGLKRLSAATGVLVIPVDHMGKDQERGARGTSAKVDMPETIFHCLVDRDNNGAPINNTRRMVLRKLRDGTDEGRVIPYRLQVVDMGKDEDGDPITTCVMRWEPERTLNKAPAGRPAVHDDTLTAAIAAVGGLPASQDALRAAFVAKHGGRKRAAGTAWERAVERSGLVEVDGKLAYRDAGF